VKLILLIKKLKLSSYIIIMLLSCVLIFICFFSIFINLFNKTTARDNLEYNRNMTNIYTDKVNASLQALIVNAQSICESSEILDFIEDLDYDDKPAQRSLDLAVNRFLINNLDIYDIILTNGTYRKSFYTDKNSLASLSVLNMDDDMIKTEYINNNIVFLIPVSIEKDTRKIGVCYLVTYKKMLSQVFSNNIKIANTEFFIISDSMQILMSPENISGMKTSTLFSFVFDKTSGSEFEHKIDSTKHFVNRRPLMLNGLTLYGITPKNSEFSSALSTGYTFVAIFFVTLLLFAGIAYVFFRSLNNSIYRLRGFIADKKVGGAITEPDLFSNELSLISMEINDMTNSIKNLQDENLKIKIAHNESRLKTLQNQLNPHFLFNTLNCMIGMARYYNVEQIEKICISMAKITQYSLSGDLFTTVGEELDAINDYLMIQQIRFPDRFTFLMNVDELLSDFKIIRFALQPIVENAIKYGLEPLEDGGNLTVNGFFEDNNIIFEIIDNGVGFDKKTFEEVLYLLANKADQKFNSSGCGIGILNIQNRIKLLHGNDYGISIISNRSVGTVVTIKMPVIPKGF